MEEAVTVADINIAGNVPTLPNVILLTIGHPQIPAASGPLYGKEAGFAIRYSLHTFLVNHYRLITRNHFPRRSRTRTVAPGRNENVQHLRGSKPIENFD